MLYIRLWRATEYFPVLVQPLAFCEACHISYSLLGSFFHINYIGIKVYSLLRDILAKGWIFGFNFIL